MQSSITLAFDPGLCSKHKSLRDVVATGVYQRGLTSMALTLGESAGNLSNQLSGNGRKFDLNELETYIAKTGDVTPIHYLAEKFIRSKQADQQSALAQVSLILSQLQPLLKVAGLST